MPTTFSLKQPASQGRLNLKQPDKPPVALTEKHRPKYLADVVGQGETLFRLLDYLDAPYSGAFIFSGPTGIGKTTVALALAAELGACEFGGLEQINSGTQDAEAVLRVLDNLRFTPMLGSGWKVIIADEADLMTPKAMQLWLSALEDLPGKSLIIFTTNDPGKFRDRFIDRCEHYRFSADAKTHASDAQALVDRVWTAEGLTSPPSFASLTDVVSKDGSLSYRRVIRSLEPLIAAARRKVG